MGGCIWYQLYPSTLWESDSKYSTLGYNYNNENNQQSAQFDPFMISVAQAPHYE
jgi:hypothetical protein